MQAAGMGMNFGQFFGQSQNNPALAGRGIQMAYDRVRKMITPNAMAAAQQMAARLKSQSGGKLSGAQLAQIGAQIFQMPGNDPAKFMQIAQAFGANWDLGQLPAIIGGIAVGDASLDPTKPIEDATNQNGFTEAESHKVGGADIIQGGAGVLFGAGPRRQNLALAEELGIKPEGGLTGMSGWDSASGKAIDAYFDSLHESGGKRYASIEKLITNKDITDETKIKVKDKAGKDVEVTLAQAIKYHKEELEQGDVSITTGKMAGQTVGEVTKVHGDLSKAGGQANVTVEAKGKLKDFIDLTINGGNNVDWPRRVGQPANAFTAPNALPSGS
jgi:hypothetical protein